MAARSNLRRAAAALALMLAAMSVSATRAQDDEHPVIMPGTPEKTLPAPAPWFTGAQLLRERIGERHGVIRFVQRWGPCDPQGHIDLICHDAYHRLACEGSHVDLHAVECWFWACP